MKSSSYGRPVWRTDSVYVFRNKNNSQPIYAPGAAGILFITSWPIIHARTRTRSKYDVYRYTPYTRRADVYYIDSVMRTKAVVFRLSTELIANRWSKSLFRVRVLRTSYYIISYIYIRCFFSLSSSSSSLPPPEVCRNTAPPGRAVPERDSYNTAYS